jgi:methionyl-tRNA formyltransferase
VALRIVFCGTPAFAVPALRHLIAQPDVQVAEVVTQPDRPRGRGHKTASSPVKDAAVEAGIAVLQPEKIRSEAAFEYFRGIAPDAVVLIAYGQMIPQRLIDIPRLGWINAHASLLPNYRGAAPINWTIVNGETHTGLTTMLIDRGLDTGAMLLKHEVDIGDDETSVGLTARLAEEAGPLIVKTLHGLDQGDLTPTPQDNSQATFAPVLKKEDGRIDWSLDARRIYNRIRGLQPWPGAFTSFAGKRCHIWGAARFDGGVEAHLKSAFGSETSAAGAIVTLGREAFVACGNASWLRLESVQIEGRRRVTAREFVLGIGLTSGGRFGS